MSDSDRQEPEQQQDQETAQPQATHDELHALRDLWNRHGPPIVAALCIGALLGGGITYYRKARLTRMAAANAELARAGSAAAIQEWLSKYSRTAVGPLGTFRLADSFFADERYGDALNVYESFVADNPRHALAVPARMGRCQSLEALGRMQDALAAYEEFASANKEHFLRPEALLGRARCLRQLERKDEARRAYEDMIVELAGTPWVTRAEEGLAALDRGLDIAPASPAVPTWAVPVAVDAPAAAVPGAEVAEAPATNVPADSAAAPGVEIPAGADGAGMGTGGAATAGE